MRVDMEIGWSYHHIYTIYSTLSRHMILVLLAVVGNHLENLPRQTTTHRVKDMFEVEERCGVNEMLKM